MTLGGGFARDRAGRCERVLLYRIQQRRELFEDLYGRRPRKALWIVEEPEPDFRGGLDDEHQAPRGFFPGLEPFYLQSAELLGAKWFAGKVLKDENAFEQGGAARQGGRRLDDGQGSGGERNDGGDFVLNSIEPIGDTLVRDQAGTHGDGIEQETHHFGGAFQIGRAAGDRGAEADVVATGPAGQKTSPGSLNDGIQADAARPGEACQRLRGDGGDNHALAGIGLVGRCAGRTDSAGSGVADSKPASFPAQNVCAAARSWRSSHEI